MLINDLLGNFDDCKCGLVHNCDIKDIIIEKNAISKIPEMLNKYNYKNIVMVSDTNTYKVCGEEVTELLKSSGVNTNSLVFNREGVLVPDERAIAELLETVSNNTDIIVGIGSGVINDLCKYISFKIKIPYMIVATAPSMDGYASVGAAMIIGNMKVTYNAHVPKIIIGDIDILKNAPMDMIRAGFGDIIGKFSALNDWKLSNVITGEILCNYVYGLAKDSIDSCIKGSDGIISRSDDSICSLMEGLVIVGIAMSYMNNSRPASGSEHHLSHFYEVISIMSEKPYFLHGIDVAYSTVITCELRHKLANITPEKIDYIFNREEWVENIKRIYGDAAEGVIALQDKLQFYSSETVNMHLNKIMDNWDVIKNILLEVPKSDEVTAILEKVGIKIDDFYNEYGVEMINNSIQYSKDLKDRYTLFWSIYELGLQNRI